MWIVVVLVLLTSVTPFPAIVSFRTVWGPHAERYGRFSLALFVFPTCICPLVLLLLYAWVSHPMWKIFGTDYIPYMAQGRAAYAYLPIFTAANFIVAGTILNRNFVKGKLLPELSLLTCMLTCFYFGLKELNPTSAFPVFAGISYSYGLVLFVKMHGAPRWLLRHFMLITVWLMACVGTVFASVVRTRAVVADLPDSPECFIVSAAAHGHGFLVCSEVDALTGQTVNNQLKVFRAFEARLAQRVPRIHKLARRIYNKLGPLVARSMIFRWQADLVYILLKPFEWAIRLARLS
ncbi:MAG: DUF6688 family protein [Fuerstiella sp.]